MWRESLTRFLGSPRSRRSHRYAALDSGSRSCALSPRSLVARSACAHATTDAPAPYSLQHCQGLRPRRCKSSPSTWIPCLARTRREATLALPAQEAQVLESVPATCFLQSVGGLEYRQQLVESGAAA
eukprot:Amastigsp_a176090_11.p3 type:complete len:127 gc:universal Amastigsp_a176090_11:817-437(-)